MNIKMKSILLLIVVVLFSANLVQGGSIWAKRNQSMKSLYADDKARYIGDVLTIVITEESTLENKSKRSNSKSTDRSVEFDGKIGADFLSSVTGFDIAASSDNKLDTKADFKDERSFEDSITVVIVDIGRPIQAPDVGSRPGSCAVYPDALAQPIPKLTRCGWVFGQYALPHPQRIGLVSSRPVFAQYALASPHFSPILRFHRGVGGLGCWAPIRGQEPRCRRRADKPPPFPHR